MRIGTLFVLLACFATHPGVTAEKELAWRLGLARASVDTHVPSTVYGSRDVVFDDVGIRFAFETRLSKRLGLEVGWMDFGAERYSPLQRDHASAAWLAFTPTVASGPWRFAAKIGAASAIADMRFSSSTLALREKSISTELFAGVSANYQFTDRHGVQLSVEQVGDVATVASLDYRYGWRAADSVPPAGLGFELLIGTGLATLDVDSVRYSIGPDQFVVVDEIRTPDSTRAVGMRVPYTPWLSFEVLYFPTSDATHFTTGEFDPPLPVPPDPSGAPTLVPWAPLSSKVELEATLVAARFEYDFTPDFDVFATLGALVQRESVKFRDAMTQALVYSESNTRTHPWLGVGMRYRIIQGLALTVEVARADGENRSRAMLGWSF